MLEREGGVLTEASVNESLFIHLWFGPSYYLFKWTVCVS